MAPTVHGFIADRHVKYWLRCAKTYLPSGYTSTDSNRMMLAFFIVSACDLLGILNTKFSEEERKSFVNWVYHCEVPKGGFRGFTGTDLGSQRTKAETEAWDPASVAATFMALLILLILGDDLTRLERKGGLQWLAKMQRTDGSFGDTLGENEQIEGGNDLRFCYCAAGIRLILRGDTNAHVENIPDIDVERLLTYIRSCQSFEGGFSQGPSREAHSGLTYCALACLSCLESIPASVLSGGNLQPLKAISYDNCVRWLASRQTPFMDEDDLNKQPTEWTGSILGQNTLIDDARLRAFLLGKVQHPIIGGFAKAPDELPGEKAILEVDPTLCTSRRARNHLKNISWRRENHAGMNEGQDVQSNNLKDTFSGDHYIVASGG
ncbi:MAG: hypothetical protein Q9227_003340 [Pyrenula ochraceoflavens]